MCPRPSSCDSLTRVDTSTATGADILTGFLGTVKAWLSGSVLRADDWAWTAAPRARLQAALTPSRATKMLRSTLGQKSRSTVAVEVPWGPTFKESAMTRTRTSDPANSDGPDAWTHSLYVSTAGWTDHLSGFGTNGAEARFYWANRTFSTPSVKNPILGDKGSDPSP